MVKTFVDGISPLVLVQARFLSRYIFISFFGCIAGYFIHDLDAVQILAMDMVNVHFIYSASFLLSLILNTNKRRP